jgi:lipoprotein-anchoring transpeptidase ErfK/SrfK
MKINLPTPRKWNRYCYLRSMRIDSKHLSFDISHVNSFRLIVFLAIAFLFSACAQPSSNVANPAPTNSAPANPAPAKSAPPVVGNLANANITVTLPLVDALLAEESFVNEVKSILQLSDEQIQKLKDAARNDVLNLDENNSDDPARSTSASARKAEKTVKDALGDEKASQFLSLMRDRIAGTGADQLAVSAPNSVPTDTRIVVNIPGYRMDVFENGQLKKTYRIGIGYPEFPLPTGLRRAETIIFNPEWTPPDEPWVKGKFKAGKTVEAGSKDNPLGPIKIPIGLPSLIHGGKSPGRIGTFASHGCVGLTNAQVKDFALQLSSLSGSPLNQETIAKYLADKTDTKNLKLNSPVPVELRYETIVVEDGTLKIFRDVYERGTNTEENLRKVLEAAGASLDNFSQTDREQIIAGLQKMAYDATGNPVDENGSGGSNANSTKATKSTGKVTRNIKGQKEIVFELAQLKGKGYPAPVNPMNQ